MELADEAKRLRRVGHRIGGTGSLHGERSAAERVNGGLKDTTMAGEPCRVRGPEKVMCHLMFGILSFPRCCS